MIGHILVLSSAVLRVSRDAIQRQRLAPGTEGTRLRTEDAIWQARELAKAYEAQNTGIQREKDPWTKGVA